MNAVLVGRLDFPGGGRFEVVVHDLLREPSDAIVNAANGRLAHGGGIAALIAGEAGPDLVEEGCRIVRERGPLAVGEAVVTTAGRLPFKGVIHAVGPRHGEGDEEGKLGAALANSFLRAHERGWESVSFPAVSSGIFAVPPETCARAYLAAARGWLARRTDSPVRALRLALREEKMVETVRRLLCA